MQRFGKLRLSSIASGTIVVAVALAAAARGQDAGPPAGGKLNATGFTAEQRGFWSFQKPLRPAVPAVREAVWMRNPIDAFVLAKLEAAGLKPSPAADKRTLIRRVTFDLIGLPPTPEEVEAFLADDGGDAYERLVDRLLQSPHYGERWARMWLDLARYAESDGFKTDGTRPLAWRYRDYVIESLNNDKPYDQFIREQIAGDEIDAENPAALIATAFNRHWPDEDNARNLVLRRQEILNDITDTTASVFLGLSVACARCHDHKYDPITQRDYYRLQAFFAAVLPSDTLAGRGEELEQYREQMKEWEEATAAIRAEMDAIETPVKERMRQDTMEKFVTEVREAMAIDPGQRTPLQQQYASMAEGKLEITTDAMVGKMTKDDRDRWTKLRDSLKELDKLRPPSRPLAMILTDVGREAPPTYLLRRGLYNAPEEEVDPGFLSILDSRPPEIRSPLPSGEKGRGEGSSASNSSDESAASPSRTTGRRTMLANWLASPDNPFTARVVVNRLWQGHFAGGIVATPSDFGAQGDPPTHPELLDWLAIEFIARGWSMKAMHRLMVTSNTYRQSSFSPGLRPGSEFAADPRSPAGVDAADPAQRAGLIDPDNTLLWRMNRQRLEGEIIRDAMLATSGELNPRGGGPSAHPELPPGISERYGWKASDDPAERNRRSIYVFVRRNMRYPLFELFDMPDTHETCGRRNRTTTAAQSLFLLNSELILSQARALAGRVLCEAGSDTTASITRAFRLAFGRAPSTDELRISTEFLARQAELARARSADSAALALPTPMPDGFDPAAGAALTDFCHALFNANEFVYVD
jgi:hypothetical protein